MHTGEEAAAAVASIRLTSLTARSGMAGTGPSEPRLVGTSHDQLIFIVFRFHGNDVDRRRTRMRSPRRSLPDHGLTLHHGGLSREGRQSFRHAVAGRTSGGDERLPWEEFGRPRTPNSPAGRTIPRLGGTFASDVPGGNNVVPATAGAPLSDSHFRNSNSNLTPALARSGAEPPAPRFQPWRIGE